MQAGSRARALALIIAAVALAGVAAGLSRLALARMVRYEMSGSAVLVASLTSWFMAPRALAAVLGGAAADALGPGRAWRLLIGPPMLLISLVVYLVSLATTPAAVLLLNTAWGLLSGLAWPSTQVAVASLARGRSNTALAVYFAVASLGMSLGNGAYALVPGNREALRLSALLFAASGAVLLAAAPAASASAPPRRAKLLRSLLEAARSGAWLILLAAFASGYSSALLRELLYIYLSEYHGLGKERLSGVLLASGVLSFAAGLAVGPLADRMGVPRVLAYILAMGAVGNTLLASPIVSAAFAGLVLAMVSSRSSLPLTRNAAVLGAAASTLVGASNAASNLGQVVSPLIGGLLYEENPVLPFLSSSIVLAAAAAAAARLGR